MAGKECLRMSATVKRVNSFFRSANRADVDRILSEVILSERQRKIFDMYYIQKHDVGFIADTLNASYSVIKSEIKEIRLKISRII